MSVLWLDEARHHQHRVDTELVAGQLACEYEISPHHEAWPSQYNEEDITRYRDWIVNDDIIPVFRHRIPYLWIQALVDDHVEAIAYSNSFTHFNPKFNPKTPDEKKVRAAPCSV